jgi:hypothetical protein
VLSNQVGWHLAAPSSVQTFRAATVMSALPPKADICCATAHVCYGPKADIDAVIRSPRRLSVGAVEVL